MMIPEGGNLEDHVRKLPLSSDTALCTTMATLVVAEPPHSPMLVSQRAVHGLLDWNR